MMGEPSQFLKLWYLCTTICIMAFLSKGVDSQTKNVVVNVGQSSSFPCEFSNPIWFKNGDQLTENRKVKPAQPTLYIYCVELSDSGLYECRDGNDESRPRTFNLTVNNPDNKELFHIYNKVHKQCFSFLSSSLHAENCDLSDCRQKWSWTRNEQLVSANDVGNPLCIDAISPVSGQGVHLEACSNKTTQRWTCNDDLLALQGHKLYLNYGNSDVDVILSSGDGSGSRWVKYNTGKNLCITNRRAVVTPARVIKSEREAVNVRCQGINFYNPTYTWLKDGKPINKGQSSLSLHLHSDVLFIPFAYNKSSGNYTCVVEDQRGTASASVVVEVYKDPSVIRHSLNQKALFGKEICLSCEMFSNSTYKEILWFKEGQRLMPSGDPHFYINTTATGMSKKFSTELCIASLDGDDMGVYSCEIKQATINASAQGKLLVLVKPVVHIYNIEDRLLICNASGFPPPRLTWYKDDKYVMDSKQSLAIEKTDGNFTCKASNTAGNSSASLDSVVPVASKDSRNSGTVIIIGCVVGGTVLAIIVIFIICCYCRRKKQITNDNYEGVYHTVRYTPTPGQSSVPSEYTTVDVAVRPGKSRLEFQPRSSTDPGPKHFGIKAKYHSLKPRAKGEWEVPYECIKFSSKLGEGQFGQVWKGDILARKGSRTVAIKMLHENASAKDRKGLIDELEFMKTMSPHPNIVGLVGCCTRSENVMILVEFVPGGNLKDYLLQSRGNSKETYANLAPYSATLTSKDLLTFGYQIARGMSYLEQIKCVHRDLAARNVLVGEDKTCKIADFGLARDIYCENYYRKTNGGRLPLRWMAYESIFNGITTNQSDAWSFGIVLWEIVTLGGNPYPDMNRDEVIDGLQRGYRMPKPRHCSEEVYAVMWECWQQNPDKRPTFAELTATFLRLISLQQIFINMKNFGEEDYVNVGSYEETDE